MISTAEVYERDGIVQVPGLLTKPEVEQVRTVFMDQVAKDHSLAIDDGVPVDDPLARYPRFVHPHRRDDVEAGRLSLELILDSLFEGVARFGVLAQAIEGRSQTEPGPAVVLVLVDRTLECAGGAGPILFLKQRIADREYFIENYDLRIQVCRDRKRKAHIHSAGVPFHGGVDEFFHFSKGHNAIKLPVDVGATHAQNGAVQINIFPSSKLTVKTSTYFEQRT